jgi:hypothetical protein
MYLNFIHGVDHSFTYSLKHIFMIHLLTYLQIYLATLAIHNIVVKYNLLIFRWGVLYLQTILTHILSLWYSGNLRV